MINIAYVAFLGRPPQCPSAVLVCVAMTDYVFSPSATVPAGQTNSNVYPRLRPNQSLRSEVLAMGHRLAADPAVQTAIVNDIVVSI